MGSMHPGKIFLGTLLVSLLTQGWLWHHITFVDKYLWVEHMQHLVQMDNQMFSKQIYGHPGTPAMDVAILAHWVFGIAWEPALLGSLALLNAVSIAGIATVAYLLKPNSWWWVAAAGMVLTNRLYFSATPPTAVVAPLLTFITLLTWWLYEKGKHTPWRPIIIWAAAMGIAGATRADMSGLFAIGLLIPLVPRLGWKKIIAMIAIAWLVFWAINPFMWWVPVRHVADLLGVMRFHYTEYEAHQIPLAGLLLISPLALIGLLLAGSWMFLTSHITQPVPPKFLRWLMFLTAAICVLLFQSRFQANRYFFPLAFVWEAILPLFVLEGVQHLRFDWIHSPWATKKSQQLAAAFVVVLLLGGQWTMLLHLYWLPEVKIICSSKVPTIFCQGNKAAILW